MKFLKAVVDISNIIPVLDDQDNYLGYYELTDIISIFNETPFVGEPGGIITVAKGMSDYSFSEISQLLNPMMLNFWELYHPLKTTLFKLLKNK